MKHTLLLLTLSAGVLAVVSASAHQAQQAGPPAQPPATPADQPPRRQSEISLIIGDTIGAPPRMAVPDFLAVTGDAETIEAAKTIAQVLWDDLDFEREFQMVPRDTYRTIPQAASLTEAPLDRWRELGADGVVIGTARKLENGQLQVQARLFNTRSLESVYGVEYTGSFKNLRTYAHELSDEIHFRQRGVKGVARTKIAFVSDRDSQSVLGLVENRPVKEIYIADYDGASARRVTVSRALNITPAWSADARALAYTSYRRGVPDIFISYIYQGTLETPAGASADVHNFLPAWSPDGKRVAFTSNRDKNPEIYVMNADGTDVRRLTTHPGIDTSPTWSPTGRQIAFTSDRSGTPQIYVIEADGTGIQRLTYEAYCDRPSWSPAPYNEIAYTSRTGPGFDIKAVDVATREIRQLTFGVGSNESPSYAPNGRHIVFMSSRGSGAKQIYTIGRDGRGLRRLTNTGNNEMPSWSP